MPTFLHTYIAYICTYINLYIHTYIHTYIRKYRPVTDKDTKSVGDLSRYYSQTMVCQRCYGVYRSANLHRTYLHEILFNFILFVFMNECMYVCSVVIWITEECCGHRNSEPKSKRLTSYIHTYIHTYIHKYIYIYIHAYINFYTYKYTNSIYSYTFILFPIMQSYIHTF